MKKSGNPPPRQCYGFNGFAGGNQGSYCYSGGMGTGMGGAMGFSGGGTWAGAGGWGSNGGWGNNGGWMNNGAGAPIVLGGGGGSGPGGGGGMQQSGNSANYIDVNIPLKQIFSNQSRNNQRRRFRPSHRAYRPVPISITNYNPVSARSTPTGLSSAVATPRSSRSAGRANPPPTPTSARRTVAPRRRHRRR